jgi:hypothetical protein
MLFEYMYGGMTSNFKRSRDRSPTIYVPNCSCFIRNGEDPNQAPKSRGNTALAMGVEIVLGCVILGLVILLIAWLSHWFSRGKSSRTERAIILLWMCEGAFGLLLPLISLKELIMVFFLLPFYAIVLNSRNSFGFNWLYIIGFVPAGIFVAPIWGFALVGRMLVQWGNCVRLF